jgi:23S rRNA pseudouridine1911/1915/1917 synthase
MSSTVTHTLPDGAPRLDRFLSEAHPEIARSRWDTWLRAGNVRVNGVVVTKAGTRLRNGAVVETELPELVPPAQLLTPELIDLPTLFEDDRLWIIDKPSGMVVHPGPGHASGTVLNALLGRLHAALPPVAEPTGEDEEEDETPAPVWPGLVHRLDRYTTGCLVMAKDQASQAALQAQFKDRTVEKRYLAVVRMSRKLPELGTLMVDEPIARHRVDRLKMTVNAAGRPSQTRVKVLAKACGLALVECELLTGRTHQIRLHLSHLGAPILGDPVYGGASAWLDADKRHFACPHPMLHAWKLAVDHPGDGRRLEMQAELPEAFLKVLGLLGIPRP